MIRSKHRVFFFNDTATTEIYTLSLHDALPISWGTSAPTCSGLIGIRPRPSDGWRPHRTCPLASRCWINATSPASATSTGARCRSEEHTSELSHANISYAVFCLKKKKKHNLYTL